MTTILVLGATGITGKRISDRLLRAGITVRAASRTADAAHVRFAWDDVSTHDAALAGVEALYLVPPPLVVDPSPQITALLARARTAGVRRVVVLTSLGVTFPTEPPDSGRRAMERAVTSSGLGWTVLRPGGFMQNFSEGFLLPGILRGGGVRSATGRGEVAMIDADDIAEVAALALRDEAHVERTYALTGPAALGFARAMEVVSEVAGRPLGHEAIAPAELAALLGGFGLPAPYAAMLVRDQEAIRDGHAAAVSPDVERVLGRPPGDFASFARRAAAAWRA